MRSSAACGPCQCRVEYLLVGFPRWQVSEQMPHASHRVPLVVLTGCVESPADLTGYVVLQACRGAAERLEAQRGQRTGLCSVALKQSAGACSVDPAIGVDRPVG